MEIETLSIPKEQAKQELRLLRKAVKDGYISKKQVLTRDFLKIYAHTQRGGSIIDIFEAFKKHGLRKDGFPKLGIIPADAKLCYCYKLVRGQAVFSKNKQRRFDVRAVKSNGDIGFPYGSFNWGLKEGRDKNDYIHNIKEPHVAKSLAPIIPAKILATKIKALLPNYHIIFEVENWEKTSFLRPPRDPILGKMLTPNLFGVLATWDLTPLERAVIRGRMKQG